MLSKADNEYLCRPPVPENMHGYDVLLRARDACVPSPPPGRKVSNVDSRTRS
jgi:hypothetical protein